MRDRRSTDDSIAAGPNGSSEVEDGDSGASARMVAAIGPCHTAENIARTLNRSTDKIALLAGEYRLLALTAADGHLLPPAFQQHNGQLAPGLRPVLSALREGVDDPRTWALWLNSTPPVVEGIAPGVTRIQQPISGESHIALHAAERSASSWRS